MGSRSYLIIYIYLLIYIYVKCNEGSRKLIRFLIDVEEKIGGSEEKPKGKKSNARKEKSVWNGEEDGRSDNEERKNTAQRIPVDL